MPLEYSLGQDGTQRPRVAFWHKILVQRRPCDFFFGGMAPRCQVQYKNITGIVRQSNHLLKNCSRYVKAGDACAQKILPWLRQKRSALSQEIILGFSPMVSHKFVVSHFLAWDKREGVVLERFLVWLDPEQILFLFARAVKMKEGMPSCLGSVFLRTWTRIARYFEGHVAVILMPKHHKSIATLRL